jgi:hypothetical protein
MRLARLLRRPRCRCLLRRADVFAGGRAWCARCFMRGIA